MKKHTIAGLATVAVVMTGIISPAAFAAQPASTTQSTSGNSVSQAQHQLPILKVTPTDGATVVRPDAPVQIFLDPSANTFQRFHEQFVKGAFQVTLNGQAVTASYDDTANVITVHNSTLNRYTTYTVGLAVKSSLHASSNVNAADNTTYSFSFETGSAIGEATHVQASVANSSVSVLKNGDLNLTVTDDYGDAATNATVDVTGNGPGNSRLASSFKVAQTTTVSNGAADIALADHTAETVSVNYTVQDNTYKDAVDTNSGNASEQFLPGPTAQISVQNPSQFVVGRGYTLTGTALDVYGNNVVDGTVVSESSSRGSITDKQVTSGGNYSFGYTAPTKAGSDSISIVSGDSSYQVTDVLTVVHDVPANVQLTLPVKLTQGQQASVSGLLTDRYGNPVDSSSISFSGALSGTLTTGSDGTFAGNLTVGQSGAVSASVGGQAMALTGANGQAISSITTTPAGPVAPTVLQGQWNYMGMPGTYNFVSGGLAFDNAGHAMIASGYGLSLYNGGYSWREFDVAAQGTTPLYDTYHKDWVVQSRQYNYYKVYSPTAQLVRTVYLPWNANAGTGAPDVNLKNGQLAFGTEAGVYLSDPSGTQLQQVYWTPGYNPYASANLTNLVAFDQNSGMLYIAYGKFLGVNTVSVYNPSTRSLTDLHFPASKEWIVDMKYDAKLGAMVVLTQSNVYTYDIATGTWKNLGNSGLNYTSVGILPNGNIVAMDRWKTINEYDALTESWADAKLPKSVLGLSNVDLDKLAINPENGTIVLVGTYGYGWGMASNLAATFTPAN